MTTSNVKKAYVELVELLEANKDKKVSTVLPQVLTLVQGKSQANTFLKDENGEVIAIFCYYHKKWEVLTEVEYGKKASTSTGFNTMCKEGTNQWSKQQRQAKAARDELLDDVANEKVPASELPKALEAIEAERHKIVPIDHGFDTEEEALEFHNS